MQHVLLGSSPRSLIAIFERVPAKKLTGLVGQVDIGGASSRHSWMGDQSRINVSISACVLLVPLHSCSESFFPSHLFFPSQFMQFAGIDGVTKIVELPVGNELNPLLFFLVHTENLEKSPGNINVGDFVLAANVVHMAWCTLVENDVECRGNILDVEEVTSVGSISMNSQGHFPEKLVRELGNKLLGKLVGTVDVVSASDQNGQLERAVVGLHQELGTSLGGSVRVGGFQDVIFSHCFSLKVLSFSVHFIGRHMNKALDGGTALGRLQENMCSVDVGVSEGKRVTEGVIDMGLGGKMHNGVDFFFLQDIRHKVRGANVPFDELEVWQGLQLIEVGKTSAVIKLVVDNYIVLRVFLRNENSNVRSNKACPTNPTMTAQESAGMSFISNPILQQLFTYQLLQSGKCSLVHSLCLP